MRTTPAQALGSANGRPPSLGPTRRHDPRIDPPTKADKRRLWLWVALLGFCPICLGVVAWAALDLNGNYPTVAPAVPAGWQAVRGIYASFSAPKSWALQQFLSDDSGEIYYGGPGGGVGLSVQEADTRPAHEPPLPSVVGDFLQAKYHISSIVPIKVRHATDAWRYTFSLANGKTGAAILAWVRSTETRVWLVTPEVNPADQRVFGTLALLS